MGRNYKTKSGILVALMLLMCSGFAQAQEKKQIKLLYWNIQNGMWDGQGDNYGRFVQWVAGQDPDICVWAEAQTNYKTDSDKGVSAGERFLPDGWSALAARYGHKYVWKGGHRDRFPQVITSKYPIENVSRICGSKEGLDVSAPAEEDTLVLHGAGWAAVDIAGRHLNIVTLHLAPHQWAPWVKSKQEREESKARFEGDKFRRREIQYICEHTILSENAGAAGDLWMMMGDFNSRSRLDNAVYHHDDNSTKFLVHDYVLNKTPFKDALRVFHPDSFCRTTYYECRLDYVYLTQPLCDIAESAEVITDRYTAPVRDPQQLSNFWRPSDHLPILVTFGL